MIAQAWTPIEKREDAAVAGASVNPPLIEPLEHAVEQATRQRSSGSGRDIDLPIKVAPTSPRRPASTAC